MTTINTVCLCGSARFDFNAPNVELAKRGFSVFSISLAMPKANPLSRLPDPTEVDSSLKEYLDLVHLNKILRSDAVFVIGDGYIGRSTAREILWAEMHGKPIVWAFDYRNSDWEQAAAALRLAQPPAFSLPIIKMARKVLGL